MKQRIKMQAQKSEPMFMENVYSSYLTDAVSKLLNGGGLSGASHVSEKDLLISMLKDAFCEEMNAWYQYLIVAPFIKGNERTELQEIMEEQGKDEYEDHAMWILERINKLGGNCDDIDTPDCWNKVATHKFIKPKSLKVKDILDQNIEAEQGAIETYKRLEKFSRDVDPVTNLKVKDILADEEEHLLNLIELKEDLNA